MAQPPRESVLTASSRDGARVINAFDEALDPAVFIAAVSLSVYGGPNQPPCRVGQQQAPRTIPLPMLSDWLLALLAALAALFGAWATRVRF